MAYAENAVKQIELGMKYIMAENSLPVEWWQAACVQAAELRNIVSMMKNASKSHSGDAVRPAEQLSNGKFDRRLSLARSTAPTDLRGRIERGLRDGGRRAGPSHDMSDMDGRALRASAITPDGRHPGRTARHPFWPFCGGRAARRISMHGKWTELLLSLIHISEPTRPY